MRRKILFLTRWYPNRVDKLDGNFIENHARAVSKFCDLAVLYIGSDPNMSDRKYDWEVKTEFGFTVVRVWYRNNDVSKRGIGRMIKFFRYLNATRIGWRMILKSFGMPHINHVHIFMRPVLLAFYLRYKFGIPFLMTEHSSHFVHEMPVLLPPMKWLAQFTARQATFITAVSKTLQEAMIGFGLQGNYVLVPNVVFTPAASGHGSTGTKDISMVAIGGLTDSRKNISGLIDVFGEMHNQVPTAVLNIVRPVPDQLLYDKAMQTGLLNRKIFFHDYLSNDQVYHLLSACSFLVVNSISETFSMAAAEALACGKPVISTRCGGPEEFISEERGILIDLNNDKQLSDAIMRMCNTFRSYDPVKLNQFARDHFSEEIVGKKLLELYEDMIAQRSQ